MLQAGSDLQFEVELLKIGDFSVANGETDEDADSSMTDTVMGGIFGGAWSYLTGVDLLPNGPADGVEEEMPHAWTLVGCPDVKYDGQYIIDEVDPIANEKPHYKNQNGLHMYFRGGWWVHKDIFTPGENSSISRVIGEEEDGSSK